MVTLAVSCSVVVVKVVVGVDTVGVGATSVTVVVVRVYVSVVVVVTADRVEVLNFTTALQDKLTLVEENPCKWLLREVYLSLSMARLAALAPPLLLNLDVVVTV